LAVAGGVVLMHALLLCAALLVRSLPKDEPVVESFVMLPADLSTQPRLDALAAQPRQADPQLQKLAPALQDIKVEQFDIEVPDTEVRVAPILASISPPAAPVTAEADSGLAGNAADSSGNAGDGGGLVLLRRVMPEYPAVSARRGEEGITTVLLHVTESGRVDAVKVERSSGSKYLDQAAVEAFRGWRFQALAPGSAPGGKWLRTAQRFVTYPFTYSRLDADADQGLYEEHLKPKPGKMEDAAPGAREALIRFIEAVRSGTIQDVNEKQRAALTELAAKLQKWGAVKTVLFSGLAGSSQWVNVSTRPERGSARRNVEVSWNMFEVQHERAVSEWLIATDRAGGVWAARAAEARE
jgi:protein TonB